MKYVKLSCLVFLVMSMLCSVGLAQEKKFSASDLGRMSSFISNFSKISVMNVSATQMKEDPNLYVRFGVWHNFMNNYTVRVKPVPHDNKGLLSIDVKYVRDTLKKYFDIDIDTWPSVDGYTIMGDTYIFSGATGGDMWFARVTEAEEQSSGGNVNIRGYFYETYDENEIYGTFTAIIKPHKWKGKNTWALVSLEGKDKEGLPLGGNE